jgi:hypothetical protein
MADYAAFDFRFVLINEGPLLVGVAFVADLVLADGGTQLVALKSAMRIVTVIALQQALIYAMVERTSELRAHVHVTGVTKLWRGLFQQKFIFLRVMRRMAVDARHATLQVGRAPIIALIVTALVTIQAARADVRRRSVFKGEDLRFIAPAVHVFFAGAMTCFATMPLGALVGIELSIHGGGEVRSVYKIIVDVFVAGLAGLRANIECRITQADIIGSLRGVGSALAFGRRLIL